MDTVINYCEPGYAYMSSDERRWINAIHKLAAQKPDECIVMCEPEDNHGFIYAKFPQKWVRVKPPKEIVMSDEQRANLFGKRREIRRSDTTEEDGLSRV